MENELYVVWLVRTSERARATAGEVLGDFAMTDLVRRIGRFAQTEDRLADLAARIRAAFIPPQLPAVLTERHLRSLVDRQPRLVLAEVLECPDTEVFATLFDAGQLAHALREAGHAGHEVLDAELLLLELLPRLPRLAARHGLDARDWGGFVERQSWLTPQALDRLTAVARRREWPADAQPTQILAGVLEGIGGRRYIDPASRFDALALIELRRRVGLLAEQLRNDATEQAEEAALLATDLTSVARLPAWIELYERNSVAVGLHRLFTGATSVSELLDGVYMPPPDVTGEPKPDESLQVANDIVFGVLKRRISFDITCAMEGFQDPQVILQCRGLPRDAFPDIRATIQQVRGSDLAALGNTLGDRLLHTQVAQHHGLPGRLRLALRSHGAEAIQCVVLTGNRQPVVVPPPWHEYLATTLPFGSPPTGDTRIPELSDVARDLRASVTPGRRVQEVG